MDDFSNEAITIPSIEIDLTEENPRETPKNENASKCVGGSENRDPNKDGHRGRNSYLRRGSDFTKVKLIAAKNWIQEAGDKAVGEVRRLNESVELDEETRWLQWMEKQFTEIAGEDQHIDLAEFKRALRVKKCFFAERFFALFDTDGSGVIDLKEMMDGLRKITQGTKAEKLKFLFDVYDVDGNGTIDFDELKTVLLSCMEESSMKLSDEDINDLTRALFDEADADGGGCITFEELEEELNKYPDVINNLTMSAAQWLNPPEPESKGNKIREKLKRKTRYLTKDYIMNNLRKVTFLILYFLVNVGLFTLSAVKYRSSNWAVIIARGCGMTLNFNSAFVLVLMLRYCLTWLRTTRLGHYLPMDQSILFHKIVGINIFAQSVIHTVAHLVNIQYTLDDHDATNGTLKDAPYAEVLFTLKADIGWLVPEFAYLSGVLLMVTLTIMVACSMPFVRRSGFFQVFYWTHMLYIVFWILLILHGPIFWYFFIAPGIIFIIERVYTSKAFKLAKYGHVFIEEVNLLPSKVTHLVISKPEKFRFRPGDYIFLNIPAIANHEWHPFTISSCPENTNTLWVHVRSAGHWTSKLYDFFETISTINHNKTDEHVLESGYGNKAFENQEPQDKNNNRTVAVRGIAINDDNHLKSRALKTVRIRKEVYIDGPFGTGTRDVFQTEHAVLIGSGIGVTPFASILQSVWQRYQQSKHTCPSCQTTFQEAIPENLMKMKKMDFIWINRDQKSFEWFVELLSRLEMEQTAAGGFDDFLEMQMYMTAALSKNDMKGLGLQMALEIIHRREQRDVVTGLKTRTQAGRPNWDEIFENIANNKKGRVKVFFCGAPLLAKILKNKCQQYGFKFAKENF